MTRLILLRHCESEINVNNMIAGRTHMDAALTRGGEEHAKRLAKRLKSHYGDIERIYCSTAMRARQTGAAIIDLMSIPISYHDELLERNYGKFDGMTKKDAEKNHPKDWAVWKKTRYIKGGEGVQEVADRVASIVNKAFTSDGHDVVAIVTHLGVLRAFMGRDGDGKIESWPIHEYALGSVSSITTHPTD